jgi:hypothetical protein
LRRHRSNRNREQPAKDMADSFRFLQFMIHISPWAAFVRRTRGMSLPNME